MNTANTCLPVAANGRCLRPQYTTNRLPLADWAMLVQYMKPNTRDTCLLAAANGRCPIPHYTTNRLHIDQGPPRPCGLRTIPTRREGLA
jgi:hypothetical protein